MGLRKRASMAGVVLALVCAALAGCASGPAANGAYTWDTSLNKLPTVAVDQSAGDGLPLAFNGHVVAVVRADNGLVVTLAIRNGRCFASSSGLGPMGTAVETQAPRTSHNDTDDQEWTGERKAIGPNETASADIRPGKSSKVETERGDIFLACGTRGAWLSIPLPETELTITGTVSLPPAAQGPAKTGIVVGGDL